LASAKEGIGIKEIIEGIIRRVPAPKGNPDAPLKALVFDSVFNLPRHHHLFPRLGRLHPQDAARQVFPNRRQYHADEIGTLKLKMEPRETVECGSVGYLISGIKNVREVKVGDTITGVENPALEAVEGFKEVKPMVFAGLYPVDTEEFEDLRSSLEKLVLNDAALVWEPESSVALGFGFRVGFLGMLHMEIVQERLEREFDITVITTVPNVGFKAILTNGKEVVVNSPNDLPDPSRIDHVVEPYHQGPDHFAFRIHWGHHDPLHQQTRAFHQPDLPHAHTCGADF
jgi:GTP-binding protein LepA